MIAFTDARLEQLKELAKVRGIPTNELLELVEQFEELRAHVAQMHDFLYVIARSNSSFSSRAQAVLDEQMFGTTDPKVIAAARRFVGNAELLRAAGAKYGLPK